MLRRRLLFEDDAVGVDENVLETWEGPLESRKI